MSKQQLFIDIKALINKHAPMIKTVELWNNQVDIEFNEDREWPYTYPAVFVSYENILWQTGNNPNCQQTEEFIIGVRVVVEDHKWNTTDFFSIVSAVNYALHGRTTAFTTSLSRSEEIQDVDHDNCIIWQINYSTKYTEAIEPPVGQTDGKQELTLGIDDVCINEDLDIDNDVIRSGDGQ